MQLLKITHVPIEYQIEMEAPRLEFKQAPNPEVNIDQMPAKLHTRTQDVHVRLDTKEARKSLSHRDSTDFAAYTAQKGHEASFEATSQAANFGNQVSEKGATISGVIKQRMIQQPGTQTVFLPSTGADISWQPNEIKHSYEAGSLSFDWRMKRNEMDFVPGKFSLNITQYPKVTIEYLGKPMYVPPSSNPDADPQTD